MHRAAWIGGTLAAVAAVAVTFGAEAQMPGGYLSTSELPSSLVLMSGPPAEGSPAAKADRAAFRSTRALVGTPRWDQALADVKIMEPGAFESWSCAVDVTIGQETTPATWKLLRRAVIDAGLGTNPAKEHYNRPRPFKMQKGETCVKPESLGANASYPSGHSAVGWTWGMILAELRPAHADRALTRGRDFGDSRVICGVHYPSDVEAGRLYGAAVVARLHADAEFQADLAAAKAELAMAPAAPASCKP